MNAFGYNQQYQPFGQQEQEYDPFTVAFGKTAETAIDVASFGIFHPDIIPEQAEVNSPIATMIGSIAGSIVGMYPSFGIATKGTQAIFKTFNFGKRVHDSAILLQSGKVIGKATAFAPTFTSISATASTFALHDAAREIVRQTQEQNPDLYEIGKSAMYGALGGMILGTVGSSFHMESPARQAIAMGAGMTLAETIVGAAEGEDVLSEDYLKHVVPITFIQGMAFGLWNSRGVGERRLIAEKVAKEASLGLLKEQGMIIVDDNGNLKPQVMKSVVDIIYDMGVKEPELFKGLPEPITNVLKLIAKRGVGLSADPKKARGQLKQMVRESEMPDAVYRDLLYSITGKKSSKDLGIDEIKLAYDKLFIEPATEAHKEMLATFNKVSEARPDQSLFMPKDRIALLHGYLPYVGQLQTATQLKTLVNDAMYTYVESSMRPQWNKMWVEKFGAQKKTIKEAFKQKIKDTPTDADYQLSLIIEGKRGTQDLTPAMNKLIGEYQMWTKMALENINAVNREVGVPGVEPREYYMTHIIDRPKMIAEGTKRADMPQQAFVPIEKWEKTTRGLGQRSLEQQRTANLPHKRDPFNALMGMFRQSTEIIYMREPMKIFDGQMDKILDLSRNATTDANVARETQHAVDGMRKWVDRTILGQPTEATRSVDRAIVKFLENNNIGQALDKMAARFGADIGTSPTKEIGSFMSRMFIRTFMGMRPKLAIRNATQWLMESAYADTESMTKAMFNIRTPLFTELLNKSMFYKMSHKQMEDTYMAQKGLMGALDRTGFKPYEITHIYGVERTALAAYHFAVKKILNPTNKYNWADADGIKLRKDGKNNNLFSPREKEYISQHMDADMNNTNFLYNVFGLPMIYSSDVARPFTTLMSFPMNYTYKYMSEIAYRWANGTPAWAKDMPNPPRLSKADQYGFLKSFVAMGVAVAALEEVLNVDMSSAMLFSWSPSREHGMGGTKWQTGIYDFRPSPAVSLFFSMKDLFSSDPQKRAEAKRNLPKTLPQYKGVPFPFAQAARDWEKAMKEGNPKDIFFYKQYKPKSKKKDTAFGGFEGFGAFQGFKGF